MTLSIFLDIGSFDLRSSVNHIILNVEEKKSYEIRKLIEEFTFDQIKNFVIFGRFVNSLKIFNKRTKSYCRIEFIKKVQESFENRHLMGNLENISFIFISNVSRFLVKNHVKGHKFRNSLESLIYSSWRSKRHSDDWYFFFIFINFLNDQALLVIPSLEGDNLTNIKTFYYKEFLMNSIEAVKRINETLKLQEICQETIDKKLDVQSFFKVYC